MLKWKSVDLCLLVLEITYLLTAATHAFSALFNSSFIDHKVVVTLEKPKWPE